MSDLQRRNYSLRGKCLSTKIQEATGQNVSSCSSRSNPLSSKPQHLMVLLPEKFLLCLSWKIPTYLLSDSNIISSVESFLTVRQNSLLRVMNSYRLENFVYACLFQSTFYIPPTVYLFLRL